LVVKGGRLFCIFETIPAYADRASMPTLYAHQRGTTPNNVEHGMAHKLQSVSQFAAERGFTEPSVRWWIFNAAANGMRSLGVVIRIGRRVYIDPKQFDAWLERQQSEAGAA
jgi:hypothetical protein